MESTLQRIVALQQELEKAVVGQSEVIEKLLIALLASGNVLLEGLPGTAKTRLVKALGDALSVDFSRIQFTPDLLPADIIGAEIYRQNSGEFDFQAGPLFSSLVLVDEINRAPAKVQSALLEAMQENQVTVAGKCYPMDDLFMVLATQNPIDQQGTYPLPEAQMDRFLLKVEIDYPSSQAEAQMLDLLRKEEQQQKEAVQALVVQEVCDKQSVFQAREQVSRIAVEQPAQQYILDLINATRHPEQYSSELAQWLAYGVSPRATISLDKSARAYAWLHGRDYITSEDIRAVLPSVLSHRLILSYQAQAEGIRSQQVCEHILQQVVVV